MRRLLRFNRLPFVQEKALMARKSAIFLRGVRGERRVEYGGLPEGHHAEFPDAGVPLRRSRGGGESAAVPLITQ